MVVGELGKSEELAGRAKDGRVVDPSAKVDGVKLEYRDEFGRKLTQKEAFRQICYRFHGYGPGKKAKEKRLKVCNECKAVLTSHNQQLPSVTRVPLRGTIMLSLIQLPCL